MDDKTPNDPAPTISKRRTYRGNTQFIARCPSNGSGFKTRAMRLAEALNGRWSHAAGGYVMSKRGAERLVKLYAEGWDGCSMERKLCPPTPP